MADTLSNEFLTSPDDNRIRPYTVGMSRHTETPATIILYSDDNSAGGNVKKTINYFSNFSSKVSPISDRSTPATPKAPSITKISLDEKEGGDNYYGIFNNFSLTAVEESSEQIVKIHQNFGSSWNAFFFGERPSVYRFSGQFIDSVEYPYYQEFLVAYDKYLCGRKCVEKKYQTVIFYDGRLVDGYLLNISTMHTAADQLLKSFVFTVLVKSTAWVRFNSIMGNGLVSSETDLNRMRNDTRVARYLQSGLSQSDNQTSDVSPREPASVENS